MTTITTFNELKNYLWDKFEREFNGSMGILFGGDLNNFEKHNINDAFLYKSYPFEIDFNLDEMYKLYKIIYNTDSDFASVETHVVYYEKQMRCPLAKRFGLVRGYKNMIIYYIWKLYRAEKEKKIE